MTQPESVTGSGASVVIRLCDLRPSHFKSHPFNSLTNNNESETVAANIMRIRSRRGDTWEELTWSDYRAEREKDTGFSQIEKGYFDRVYPMIADVISACAFSPQWRDSARAAVGG